MSGLIPSLFIHASFTLPVKALAGDYAPQPDKTVEHVVLTDRSTGTTIAYKKLRVTVLEEFA